MLYRARERQPLTKGSRCTLFSAHIAATVGRHVWKLLARRIINSAVETRRQYERTTVNIPRRSTLRSQFYPVTLKRSYSLGEIHLAALFSPPFFPPLFFLNRYLLPEAGGSFIRATRARRSSSLPHIIAEIPDENARVKRPFEVRWQMVIRANTGSPWLRGKRIECLPPLTHTRPPRASLSPDATFSLFVAPISDARAMRPCYLVNCRCEPLTRPLLAMHHCCRE